MISISGVFAVTFSVVFAYVADVTEEQERSLAYGLVSGFWNCDRNMVGCATMNSFYQQNQDPTMNTDATTNMEEYCWPT